MYIRAKFVTNSSSTSVVAYGITIWDAPRELRELVSDNAPKGVRWDRDPGDQFFIYIEQPNISVDDEGNASITNAEEFKEQYLVLKKFLEDNGLPTDIGYIEDSWYDG